MPSAWHTWLTFPLTLIRILRNTEAIMAQLDDLKALLTEAATSIEHISTDVDQLLVLAQAGDLTAVVAQATAIRDRLAAVDLKFPATP